MPIRPVRSAIIILMHTYPIDEALPELIREFGHARAAVLHAPPGAGKTTRVPLALMDMPGRIVMLEPRRLAATNAARWMAASLGEQAGETVGYTIRFERRVSERTRIEIVTEGILTRRMQSDPALEGVSVVIFDEFHERGLNTDLGLALCLDIRRNLRPELGILVMSATLDCGPVAELLGGAPVITSEGRAYAVEERYITERPDQRGRQLSARVADAVRIAIKETTGDILVFLPGAADIRAAARELGNINDIAVHQLYGEMPFEAQERAIMPSEMRRVVLATNIAETSLTIEGVRVVIDTGLERRMRHDPSSGLSRLVTAGISRASAVQRAGRAGRLGPGVCYRLYGRNVFDGMVPHSPPEITTADLSGLCLELAAWGVHDPSGLRWLDAPPEASWKAARELLIDLGAIDAAGAPTKYGRAMARLPLHPRLARMLVRAGELGITRLGADLAALLSERDILRVEADISTRLDALRRGAGDEAAVRAVKRAAAQIASIVGAEGGTQLPPYDHADIARLLLDAFPDRLGAGQGGGRFVLTGGMGVKMPETSPLAREPYIVAVNLDAGGAGDGRVHMAEAVDEALILDELWARIERPRRLEWDRREGRIAAFKEERIGAVVLSSVRFTPDDDEAAPILDEAVRLDHDLIKFSDSARQLQGRVAMLRRLFPESDWPDLSDSALFAEPLKWLGQWVSGVRTAAGLRGLNMHEVLLGLLAWEQRRELDRLAPTHIAVPSGRSHALDYASGDTPVLSVKLQEMFGLADTPTVAAGIVKVLLYLLSPANRPVQITTDLKGFWDTSYEMVKKDLRGRYPKHPWPDDPWGAAPTARTKRKP